MSDTKSPDKYDVVLSVRDHFARLGYEVSYSDDEQGITFELSAKKARDTFIVEVIGESAHKSRDIVFALGKLVKRMSKRGFWYHYGLAMPRDYFKLLKDFETVGFDALKIHLFLVGEFLAIKHLDDKQTLELMQHLKAGQIINPDLIDIGYP